ncbi:MAG TPA: hypothetical protein VGI78_26000 [Acetobacteraceae bacterium]|jgi:hypothetical protein
MEQVNDEARLFTRVVGSRYFNDIFDALHGNLVEVAPAEVDLLAQLRQRFFLMKEKIERNLEAQDEPTGGEDAPGDQAG